jgi:hypothetical protein
MKKEKLLAFLIIGVVVSGCAVFRYEMPDDVIRREKIFPLSETRKAEIQKIYQEADLNNPLSEDIFLKAVLGYDHIPRKKDILTIIDFSQPSTEKRAYVIDMKKKELLFNTWVSHGVNTGGNMAYNFSNKEGSRKSSLGFYLTAETYRGKHGLSLRLDGLEPGFNDSARVRYIVIHGADYVSPKFIEQEGRLGRSWGCPAFPLAETKPIIRKIKRGSVFFIYGEDPEYLENSLYIAK